jgi:hypothetical protein
MARGNSRASSERETPFFRAEREATERNTLIKDLKARQEDKKQDVLDVLRGTLTDPDRNSDYPGMAQAIDKAAKNDDFSKIDDVIEQMLETNRQAGGDISIDENSLLYAQRYLREWEAYQSRIAKLEAAASADYYKEQSDFDERRTRND